MAEPFFWDERGAWYVNISKPNGKRGRLKLHAVKRKAFEIWKAMEANASGLNPEVAYIADMWIADLAGRVASGTLSADYHTYAQTVVTKYLNAHPHQKWSAFTATAVSAYCGKQNWSADHTATVMGRLKQMSKWAMEHHKLHNTLSTLKKPKSKPREYFCTRADYVAMIETAMTTKYFFKDFALLIATLWHTGARPGELISATIDDYNDGVLTLTDWKNARKTGKKRSIYLNRAAQVCVLRSIGNRTTGNIFVGKGGAPYNRDMIRNRIKRLREIAKLNDELTAYTIRHGYAARALTQANPIPVITLAELMGTSVGEIERTYGHIAKHSDHLRTAANGVR